MDLPLPVPTNNEQSYVAEHGAPETTTQHKRQRSGDDGPPSKKAKQTIEVPQLYSDAVRKKLASTSRTGQACDRCKERKMKCDTDPQACQPCRQKNLPCFTTDRVTGQSRERGQSDRTETELQYLRDQYTAYQRKYGPLQPADVPASIHIPMPETDEEKEQSSSQPTQGTDKRETVQPGLIPSSQYVGWPVPDHVEPLHTGPMNGTAIDILDGIIDIADFECEMMQDPIQLNVFNVSRISILNTITGHQTITDPRLPSREDALRDVNSFLVLVSQFVPVVHGPSFVRMVHRTYDQPGTATLAEQVQLVVVLGMVSFQAAVRNHHQAAEKFEQSHYWIHYGLTWYRDLLRDQSLAAMQALTLLLVHFRNLPKPGNTWSFAHNLLVKAMELEYHRDPDKISLVPEEDNVLAKELRKRVFHSILGICITTGCRVSKPAPWQFQHMDVPLPMATLHSEISESGLIRNLSGRCDFWPCIQLAKLLPLLTELYNHITSVRRPEAEYLKIVEALHTKVDAWRHDWDVLIKHDESHVTLKVATLLMETWAAEFTMNLYHPSLCSQLSPENMDRHIEVCHKQAQRLLKNFHILSSKYKGVDFTWHSTAAYAMGFGVTLHVYRRRKGKLMQEQFEAMKNEFKGWMSLVAYADLVMRTGNHLQHVFEPRVRKLEEEYRDLLTTIPVDQRSQQHSSMSSATATPATTFTPAAISPFPPALQNMINEVDIGPDSGQPGRASTTYNPHAATTQSWPASTMMPYMQGSTVAPTFNNYNTMPGPYHPVSTSLAPLLNGSPSGYLGYRPTPSASQSDMMMFAPNHYSADGNMSWPFITLPRDKLYDGEK